MGQGIHPLQVADSFGQKPSDDLAPLDFGTGLHLAMQFRGDGQSDIGHGLDYVRAHNQTLGEGASRASPAPGSAWRKPFTARRDSGAFWTRTKVSHTRNARPGLWAIRPHGSRGPLPSSLRRT